MNEAPDELRRVLRDSEMLIWWGQADGWRSTDTHASGRYWAVLTLASLGSVLLFAAIYSAIRATIGTGQASGRAFSYIASFVILATLWVVAIGVTDRIPRGEPVLGLSTKRLAARISRKLVAVTSERVVCIAPFLRTCGSYSLSGIRNLDLATTPEDTFQVSFMYAKDVYPSLVPERGTCTIVVDPSTLWERETRVQISTPDAKQLYRVLQDARRSALGGHDEIAAV